MIAMILQVPMLDGKPDVDLGPSVFVTRSSDGVVVMQHSSGEVACFRFVDMSGGDAILAGMASKQAATWLARTGITVTRARDTTTIQRDWLIARSVTKENVGHSLCGWPVGDVPDEV